jgi:hypothetical protein
LVVEAGGGATTIAAIHGNRANRAGSFFECTKLSGQATKCLSGMNKTFQGIRMPTGRSTFTKRQKEHTRQQRQRDKAERRNQRKEEETVAGTIDEMAELRKHAAEQAALFNLGAKDEDNAEQSNHGDHVDE